MLIGLCGLPRNGKGTIANYLKETWGFKHTKMAGTLKDMLRVMLRDTGMDDVLIERMIEGDLKETPQPFLGNTTPRWAMQTLGTEWGRLCLCPTIWGDIWQLGAMKHIDDGRSVVVDDVRFPDEQERVKRLGGIIIHVTGRSGAASEHASDKMDWMDAEYTIENNGSLEELRLKVDKLIREIRDDIWGTQQPLPYRQGNSEEAGSDN